MDLRDKYKIQESIEDVVRILDLAPIRLDLNPDTNNVQLTNRMPIAHLAIERGMKALIKEAGGHRVRTHALSKLHRELLNCDRESADFLNGSFCDAVEFYGYNVNFKGFGHFRSLKDYLAKVGGE